MVTALASSVWTGAVVLDVVFMTVLVLVVAQSVPELRFAEAIAAAEGVVDSMLPSITGVWSQRVATGVLPMGGSFGARVLLLHALGSGGTDGLCIVCYMQHA